MGLDGRGRDDTSTAIAHCLPLASAEMTELYVIASRFKPALAMPT